MQPLSSGWRAHIGEDWSQGRATFGGMVAALCNEAMRRLVPADRELRGLDTTFVGPALAGEVSVDAEILRAGKAVTIARSRLWSDGKIAATLTGIYGAARATALSMTPTVAAGVRAVEDLPERSTAAVGGPAFLQHFAYRWAEGTRPFAGSNLRTSKVYVRHQDPAPLTESHVVALVDSIPSVILQLMTTVVPSSSLTWTLQLLRHDYSFAPEAWWRIDAEINCADSGYSCESCVLIDPRGRPAAVARQMVAVFG